MYRSTVVAYKSESSNGNNSRICWNVAEQQRPSQLFSRILTEVLANFKSSFKYAVSIILEYIYLRLLHTNSRCFPVKKKPGMPLIPDWHPCFGKLNFSQLLNYIFYITLNYFMKFTMSLKTRFSILERTKKKAVD